MRVGLFAFAGQIFSRRPGITRVGELQRVRDHDLSLLLRQAEMQRFLGRGILLDIDIRADRLVRAAREHAVFGPLRVADFVDAELHIDLAVDVKAAAVSSRNIGFGSACNHAHAERAAKSESPECEHASPVADGVISASVDYACGRGNSASRRSAE
ncbi:MAG: hypothetical protein IPK23_07140 [Rhizobiales bacterium]|nr:hypothetical protein [Hyphomicrobiales bacterium]